MTEINPNHPVTRAISEHWHKIAAILAHKAGGEIVITEEDIRNLPPDICVVVQELGDGLHVRVVDHATAMRLARENGGLPV